MTGGGGRRTTGGGRRTTGGGGPADDRRRRRTTGGGGGGGGGRRPAAAAAAAGDRRRRRRRPETGGCGGLNNFWEIPKMPFLDTVKEVVCLTPSRSPGVLVELIKVYSLRNDSWKTLNVPTYPAKGGWFYDPSTREPIATSQQFDTFRNEKCYWFRRVESPGACAVISFDMSTEVFELITIPHPTGLTHHDEDNIDDPYGDRSSFVHENRWEASSCFMLKKGVLLVTFSSQCFRCNASDVPDVEIWVWSSKVELQCLLQVSFLKLYDLGLLHEYNNHDIHFNGPSTDYFNEALNAYADYDPMLDLEIPDNANTYNANSFINHSPTTPSSIVSGIQLQTTISSGKSSLVTLTKGLIWLITSSVFRQGGHSICAKDNRSKAGNTNRIALVPAQHHSQPPVTAVVEGEDQSLTQTIRVDDGFSPIRRSSRRPDKQPKFDAHSGCGPTITFPWPGLKDSAAISHGKELRLHGPSLRLNGLGDDEGGWASRPASVIVVVNANVEPKELLIVASDEEDFDDDKSMNLIIHSDDDLFIEDDVDSDLGVPMDDVASRNGHVEAS
ncbi:hypothetical protein LINPERHAP1_LOCUS36602 [Linum perenne]